MPSTLVWALVLAASFPTGGPDQKDDQIARLKRSNESLTAALARSEASVAALRHRIAELEATLAAETRSFRKSIETLQREADEARRRVERLEAERQRDEQERASHREQLEAARQAREQVVEQRSRDQSEALRDRDRRIAALQSALESARAEGEGLQRLTETLAELRRENARLAETRARLEKDLEASRAREAASEARGRQLEETLGATLKRAGAAGLAELRAMLEQRDAELVVTRAERDRLRALVDRLGSDQLLPRQEPPPAPAEKGATRPKGRRKV